MSDPKKTRKPTFVPDPRKRPSALEVARRRWVRTYGPSAEPQQDEDRDAAVVVPKKTPRPVPEVTVVSTPPEPTGHPDEAPDEEEDS